MEADVWVADKRAADVLGVRAAVWVAEAADVRGTDVADVRAVV